MPGVGIAYPGTELHKDVYPPLTMAEILGVPQEFSRFQGVGSPSPSADRTGEHVFRQAAQPTSRQGAREGDIWYDTDDNNLPYKLVNGVWTSIRDGAILGTPSLLGWSQDLVWTATDSDTVTWGAGTLRTADGTSYAILAGTTGNIAAVTYIFLDTAVSLTTLQTTTISTSAAGLNRILVAWAQNTTAPKLAIFQAFGGPGQGVVVTADNIASNTVTANEILANTITSAQIAVNTITADRMNVALLSAISANLGAITAGSLSINGGVASISALGVGVFSDVQISGLRAGSVLDGQYLAANTVVSAAVNLALRSWTTTLVFSVTDLDTVAWAAGDIIMSDGTTYAILAGNTGNMAARTYIYLDIAVSTTALQTTTVATTSVGNGRKLIATAVNGTTEASYFVFSGAAQQNLDGANIVSRSVTANEIVALTITGNEIAATTITAGKMSVTILSAIAADLGTITAGTVTGALIRTAASGQRVQLDSTNGFQAYDAGGVQRASVLTDGSGWLGSSTSIFWTAAGILTTRQTVLDTPIALNLVRTRAAVQGVGSEQISSALAAKPGRYYWVGTVASVYTIHAYALQTYGVYVDQNEIATIAAVNLGAGKFGVTVIGSNVYASNEVTVGPTNAVTRYTLALGSATAMTFSGTSAHGPCATDGTDLYIAEEASTTVRRYSISGTTLTHVSGTVVGSATGINKSGFFCDGTFFYWYDNTALTIEKYTLAGVLSSSTYFRLGGEALRCTGIVRNGNQTALIFTEAIGGIGDYDRRIYVTDA